MKKLFFFLCLMATFVFTVPALATSSGPPLHSTELSLSIDAHVSVNQTIPLTFERVQEVTFLGAGDQVLPPTEKTSEIMLPQQFIKSSYINTEPDISCVFRDKSNLQISPHLKNCYITSNHYSQLGNSMWN